MRTYEGFPSTWFVLGKPAAVLAESELHRMDEDLTDIKHKIKDNEEKIKLNRALPYLVGNIVEILDLPPEDGEDDAAAMDVDAARRGKSVVVKTTMRQVSPPCDPLLLLLLFSEDEKEEEET